MSAPGMAADGDEMMLKSRISAEWIHFQMG